MVIVVSGGSGSGKSAIGERIAMLLDTGEKYYIATMEPYGEEARIRIARHRDMRKEKNFRTIECQRDLESLNLTDGLNMAMLECMSNLVSNEMFIHSDEDPVREDAAKIAERIGRGIGHLISSCKNVIFITNEVFGDGICYDSGCIEYIRCLAAVNRKLMELADIYIESVCGIPVFRKGEAMQIPGFCTDKQERL